MKVKKKKKKTYTLTYEQVNVWQSTIIKIHFQITESILVFTAGEQTGSVLRMLFFSTDFWKTATVQWL